MGYWSQRPFDLQAPTGRIALVLIIIYFFSGITGNIVRVNGNYGQTLLSAVNVFHLAVVVIICLSGLWTVIRRKAGLADYGFTLGRGAVISLSLILLLMVMNVSLSAVRLSFDVNWALPSILATSVEELIFRAWFITALITWLKPGKNQVHIAVAISARSVAGAASCDQGRDGAREYRSGRARVRLCVLLHAVDPVAPGLACVVEHGGEHGAGRDALGAGGVFGDLDHQPVPAGEAGGSAARWGWSVKAATITSD